MNDHHFVILCGLVTLTVLLVPLACAADPLWTHAATTSGELSGVVISRDGSTIVAGGDQLIALSRDGRKLWSAWSGTNLVISPDGNCILTSREQVIRMISRSGTLLWDASLEVPVTDLAMTPDTSLIAAGGGSRVRLISASGAGVRQNATIPVNHIRLFPEGDLVVITTEYGIQKSNLTLYAEWTDTNMTQDLVEIAADGSSFVSATNNRIRLYTRNGVMQWERSLPGGNTLAFAFSGDGSTIVVGRDDNTVQALDHGGNLLWTARAAHWITSVAVSDDGSTIVAGSMDKSLSVYDHAGTKLGSFLAKNPIKFRSVAVSGDGSMITAVDASAVYGFSRSQFIQPPSTAITTTATTAPVTPPISVATPAATPLPQVPSCTGTPQAELPAGILPVVLAFIILCRSRFS